MDNKLDVLRKEIQRLKEDADPKVVAAVERRASEAQTQVENLEAELEEARRGWELAKKELSEARTGLTDSISFGGAIEGGRQRLQEVSRLQNGACPNGAGVAVVRLSTGVDSTSGPNPGLDPFTQLPEDVDVLIVDDQPFDDSPLLPEE
ncbi:hypothetical protein BHE74_00003753 [Ensete ventricosum]|nr:hypothetical protein GW17_00023955 [Ensete ventricosum]RWW87411.1 hypothetical protein BHE74_00003753 [Ensete ventricosum]RZS05221.1 hypothetical protein BHM03_00035697 [Ensete ventricosum]